jgi:hypothetical protein
MSRRIERTNMNGSPEPALELWFRLRGGQLQTTLVNHDRQEYHAAFVFTSHVADILKNSGLLRFWAADCLEEEI